MERVDQRVRPVLGERKAERIGGLGSDITVDFQAVLFLKGAGRFTGPLPPIAGRALGLFQIKGTGVPQHGFDPGDVRTGILALLADRLGQYGGIAEIADFVVRLGLRHDAPERIACVLFIFIKRRADAAGA